LTLAVACASAGAASASADDSRLLPSGSAAHLWLLPKSACSTTIAPASLRAGAARVLASSRDGSELASWFRRLRQYPPAPRL